MPKAILRVAGNTALSTVLAVIANSFLTKLARDYDSWAESVPIKGQ